MQNNIKSFLNTKTLEEITEFINDITPISGQRLKPLKCKKDIAIDRAVVAAEKARKKRNRKQFGKISRKLRAFC